MPAEETDHYAALGLDRRCSEADIRKAYRLLAKRHHPDLNPNSPEALRRSQDLNLAYEVLMDPHRRSAYDRECAEREKSSPAPSRAPRSSRADRSIAQDAHLRLADFLRGTTLEVRVNDPGNPSGPEIYPLVIPPDTAPGTRFKISRHEPFADGFVQVRVKPMPGGRMKVKGSDLRCELRISHRRALDGGQEQVQGLTGSPIRVTIPRGIARGEVITVPREGLPKPRGGRGDLLVEVTYRPEVRIARTSW